MTEDKRTVAGKQMDMPEARRKTNDSALQHVPGGVHGAWALMPFFSQERGVAVAHLEGLNEGRGITATELEALQLLGDELGCKIYRWQQSCGNNRLLNCDLSLVEQLYEIDVEKYSRNPSRQTESFQNVVERAFTALPGVEVLRPVRSVRTDLHIRASGGRTVVIEATMAKDLTDKRRQLLEYVNELKADLGILVASGEIKEKAPREDLSAYKNILLMDASRLMRFVCLSPIKRGELIHKWLNSERDGMVRTPMEFS